MPESAPIDPPEHADRSVPVAPRPNAPDRDRRRTAAGSGPTGPRARLALVLFLAVILATTIGFALTRESDSTSDPFALGAAVGADARDVETTTTTAPTPTTGSIKVVPLTVPVEEIPLPDPMPANPYAPTPQVVLGQLEIPKLGVTGDIQEGITLTAINRGPGHWPGTPMPGKLGNMVIAGHRTTYTKPFERIDELVPGDQVLFHMPEGTITYEVRGVIIVPAENVGIAAASRAHTATLFACHPKHSAAFRVVAKLALLGPDGQLVDRPEDLPPVDFGADPVTGTTLMVRESPAAAATDPLAGTNG